MTKLLREKGVMLESKAIEEGQIDERPLTVAEAMQELTEVRAMPVKLKNNLVWAETTSEATPRSFLRLLEFQFHQNC